MSSAKEFHDTPFTGSDDESSTTLLEHHREAISGPRSGKPKRYIQLLVGLVVILCTVSVVYTAAAVYGITSRSQQDFGDCGSDNTVEQARAKGCVFDPMGWVWVRPECYDEKMIHEFMNRTEFTWHTEPKLRPDTQVPLEVVFRGDHPKLFTQRKYHDIHCAYMWKRMHQALLEKTPIDTYMMQWHHTEHCQQVMLDKWLHEDVQCTKDMICPTWVRATWTSCKRY